MNINEYTKWWYSHSKFWRIWQSLRWSLLGPGEQGVRLAKLVSGSPLTADDTLTGKNNSNQ